MPPSEPPSALAGAGPADPVVVVLTGGASRRMGSHKPLLEVAGRPLVARVLDAAADWPALVVGPTQGVPDGIRSVLEPVPGGGPVAGLAAAVAALPDTAPEKLVVLAADLPFVTHEHLRRLVGGLDARPSTYAAGTLPERADLAVTVTADGRTNWLCAAWRLDVLRDRLVEVGDAYGRSMRQLCADVPTAFVDDPDEVALDVDTPADLDRARGRADGAAGAAGGSEKSGS
ncbi:NTP transferase domain-containing protein [Terrabacter sp. NPDC080008]|uniref:molybdenum cofactor guanylyltransferase n=1 Tax=Terrabacter sp. NPDC080008 TaxID=3155176 RepID=UPI0034510993